MTRATLKEQVASILSNYASYHQITDRAVADGIAAEHGFDTKEALIADIEEWIINQQKATPIM